MQIFVAAAAAVLYVVVTYVAFIITLIVGARFELTYPSFPWWATIFWWIGLVAVAWYAGFRLPRWRERDSSTIGRRPLDPR